MPIRRKIDLGIEGRKAIVCGSSRGLGKACGTALAREGCSVVINGLDPERLERAATEIRDATGAKVTPMRADINTEAGRAALIAACSDADILVNHHLSWISVDVQGRLCTGRRSENAGSVLCLGVCLEAGVGIEPASTALQAAA